MAYNPMSFVHTVPTAVAQRIAAIKPKPTTKTVQPVSQSLAQAANQRVNQQLNPQIAAQNAFNTRQANVIQQFANALLGKLQPVAGQVGADYDQAIKQIGGLSGQAAQYLSGQNPAASQQQLLSSVGAPPEQQAQAAQALGDTFRGGAGVLAYTGGTIPGSELAAGKAAAQAQAAQLPGIAALKGQQDLASALWQQGQSRRELEATRPALYQQARQDIQTTNIARQRLAQQAQAAKATAIYRQQQLGLGYAKLNQSAYDKAQDRAATNAYHKAYLTHLAAGDSETVAHNKAMEAAATTRNKISQENAQTSRINAATSRYKATHPGVKTKVISDKTGQWLINAATGAVIKKVGEAKPSATAKVGANPEFPNLTKAQVLHLRSGVAAAFNGVPEQKDASGKVIAPALPPVDYQTAINHAISAGYSRAGATKMANRFYMPGQRGRPAAPGPSPPAGARGPVG